MDKKKNTHDSSGQYVPFKNLPPEFRANFYLLSIFIVASLLVVIFAQFIIIPILGGWDPLEEPVPTYSTLVEQNATWKERTVIVKTKDGGIVQEEGTAFVLESVAIDEKTCDVYLATAYHVVDSNSQEVYLISQNKEYKAEVVDVVESLDYALLKIQGEKLFVNPRHSTAVEMDEIGVYGNGDGEGNCSKRGYISREEYVVGGKFCFEITSDFADHTVLQGMSGSPVFSSSGIIGMLVEGTKSGSFGYAIPYSVINNEYKRYRNNATLKSVTYGVEKDDDGNISITFKDGNKFAYYDGHLSIWLEDKWQSVIRVGNHTVKNIEELLKVVTDYDNLTKAFDFENDREYYKTDVVTIKGVCVVEIA